MDRAIRMCAVFWLIEKSWCFEFDIIRWTPPEELKSSLCPSKRELQQVTINSTLVYYNASVCDHEKIKRQEPKWWKGHCAQAFIKINDLTRLKVACLPQHHKRRQPEVWRLKGYVGDAGQPSASDRQQTHRRRKRQQWVRRCRRRSRYWHSVGAKIRILLEDPLR